MPPTQFPQPNELKIGMLGYGFMGKCHSHGYLAMPHIYHQCGFRPRLSMICGLDEQIVNREAARFGFDRWTTEWSELAADPEIQVFDNCAPDPLHVEPTLAALRQGKHVICEKPMAVSLADARRMRDAARDAAREAGARAMQVFNYRFFPAVQFARDLINAGKLGTIHHMRVYYLQMAGHDPALRPEQVWYSAWPASGILQGIGTHAIDQCRYLVGELASVSALVRTFNAGRDVPSVGAPEVRSDEGSAALLEFESGAIGVLEASGVATGHNNDLAWEINGSHGSLRWSLDKPNQLYGCFAGQDDELLLGFREISVTLPNHPHTAAWWPPGHNLGWEHAHIIEKFHFLDAVAHNTPLHPSQATFEDGYRAAVVVDALRRSSAEGRRVELDFEA